MTNISIFVDSLCETEKYFDENFEGQICSKSIDVTNFFLNNSEIFSNSCLNNQDYSDIVINLILCDDEKIHEINREYRNVDRPTDVISFALFGPRIESIPATTRLYCSGFRSLSHTTRTIS